MSSVKKEKKPSTDLRYYISLSADKLQSKWKTIVIFIPFAWLLLFFLTPFFIVAKISLAELVITSPPFSKMIEWVDGSVITIRLVFDNFIYIFTDPKIKSKSNFVFKSTTPRNNKIKTFTNAFSKTVRSPYELNLEKNFFSKDYHQDIFFYVYSNKSKKILAQGGGYHYKKSKKKNKAHKCFIKGVILTIVSPTYQMFYRYAMYLILLLVDRESIYW